MSDFVLHPRLVGDTAFVADWSFSRVLLMNDARFPWLIVVPRLANATEIFDLNAQERAILIEEVARASAGLKKFSACAKINIGALGNLVPQLHIHIVARNPGDAAWPGPVWGHGQAQPYAPVTLEKLLREIVNAL